MQQLKEEMREKTKKEYPDLFKVSKTQKSRNLAEKREEKWKILLSTRAKKIHKMYENLTQQQIADELGITRQRIQQILIKSN